MIQSPPSSGARVAANSTAWRTAARATALTRSAPRAEPSETGRICPVAAR